MADTIPEDEDNQQVANQVEEPATQEEQTEEAQLEDVTETEQIEDAQVTEEDAKTDDDQQAQEPVDSEETQENNDEQKEEPTEDTEEGEAKKEDAEDQDKNLEDTENQENPDNQEQQENLDDVNDKTEDNSEEKKDEKDAEENSEEKEADVTENLDETIEKEKTDADAEVIPVKKEVKRKARPNKFADGNLILEEDDEETIHKQGSPGPPPLDSIGQNLDESDRLNIHGDFNRDAPGATTPDRGEMTLDEEYQEIEQEIKPTREEIIERYKAIVEERDKLQNTNNQLHHKLADYYRKRKSEETQNQPLFDKSSQEQEQRYIKYLSTIEGLRKQLERERWEAEKEMEDLKEKCELKQTWVNDDRSRFNKVKRETATKSVSIHTGKAPTNKDLDMYMQRENQKELEVINVRLENIKLKNQLKKKEMELKAKEELGEGLHMIDFEQLKIENQTYNEKIEERNEELMKLKKKINNTVQILTHVKEKLQFVFVENDKEKLNLNIYDEQVKKNRDILNRIKQSRDSLRVDNGRLKQNSGLLGNTVLLRDFEECVDQNDNLESQIEYLKRRHAELVLNSKGIKQKIAQTKNN